jgi:FlaA1/EpsC-like NDP-sugar epimerase
MRDPGLRQQLHRSAFVQRVLRGLLTVAVLASAYLGAYLLRFWDARFDPVPDDFWRVALLTVPFVVAFKLVVLRVLRTHKQSWRYTSLWDVVTIVEAMFASMLVLAGVRYIAEVVVQGSPMVPVGVILIDFVLSVIGLAGLRAFRRLTFEEAVTRRRRQDAGQGHRRNVVLIGAGRAGSLVAREILSRPDLGMHIVGFVDDDPRKQRQVIQGVEVLGKRDDLLRLADDLAVDEAVITISDARGEIVRDLADRCHAVGIEPRIMPAVHDLVDGRVSLSHLRPVKIEDLLRREPARLDNSSIEQFVHGRTVLVTGAGGSIGGELCRQLVRFAPARLVLVEQAEGALWAIHRELEASAGACTLVPTVADVCDQQRIDAVVRHERPAAVFHAAAHKHVPMMEANPGEAVKNNVFGTKVVADACARFGVERFVFISTDKAVNPSSVMGATKRVAERYVQHLAGSSGGVFVSVRFGNVLGSAGSVVPIFERQIAEGGPLTVTHPQMTRYFMTIPEASQLVIQAAALGTGGEVFVLDMGEPVRIVDLARDVIRLSGLEPGVDIDIVFTGIRPGEKLFEELALDSEHTDRTSHPSIAISTNGHRHWPTITADLERLWSVVHRASSEQVRVALRGLVPEMVPLEGGAQAGGQPVHDARAGAHAQVAAPDTLASVGSGRVPPERYG